MKEKTRKTTTTKPNMSSDHVILTSHPSSVFKEVLPIHWGEKDPKKRGPVVASLTDPGKRNAIGTHGGSYTVYRALGRAAGQFPADHRPDLTDTAPTKKIGPFPSWSNPDKMVSIDPWGAMVQEAFSKEIQNGYDIRPSIAVTTAHIQMLELEEAVRLGRLKVDGKIIKTPRDVFVTKAAIEPVWYLPKIAARLGIEEGVLRKCLFQETGGMFPELITRPDLKVLLPPIGSITAYIFGDVDTLSDPKVELTARVHDECNGSDVFGSDICTCRPYLTHGIEEAVRTAQAGGNGLIVYYRKEGRALGEVTKFLVYNARKRQEGGDTAANYFYRTECVAGVEDMRFQEMMPDTLHWLGITKIDNLISMSDMKYNAIIQSGIEVGRRVSIPDELIPSDAKVEMAAKKAAGYFTEDEVPTEEALQSVKGRNINE
jgi:GTP cyclohydrolase II